MPSFQFDHCAHYHPVLVTLHRRSMVGFASLCPPYLLQPVVRHHQLIFAKSPTSDHSITPSR